jgi:ABC-type antimicrobial peptide transport system permease subunit
MIKVILEGIILGIFTIIFGSLVGFIVSKIWVNNMPKECKDWNKNNVMEITLFFTGFIFHISFELLGINNYYAKNYKKSSIVLF